MATGPRNLLKDWCPEGSALTEAIAAIPSSAHREREEEFGAQHTDEARGATYLHIFTGWQPYLEDANGLQEAVDLTLHGSNGLLGIAEVTSTRDSAFLRDSAQLRRVVDSVDESYHGPGKWALGFEYGWTMPPNSELKRLAKQLTSALERADVSAGGDESDPKVVLPKIVAYRVASSADRRVSLSSWSTNTPNSSEAPYLDRLSSYLANSDLIAKKIAKLANEQARLGSSRQHLYLLMASTGETGGLLPTSPSLLTWGKFVCPEPVTDLWLDGATGEIYHWSVEMGWIFHSLTGGTGGI